MKKKYYFNSIWHIMIHILIALFSIGIIILCSYVDEKHSGFWFIVVTFSICLITELFWIGFSFSMRIQIDYEKKELYIIHPYFLRRLSFKEVLSIEIIDYNKVSFDFIIITERGNKKLAYYRYEKRKSTPQIQAIINELKKDLINISSKNY